MLHFVFIQGIIWLLKCSRLYWCLSVQQIVSFGWLINSTYFFWDINTFLFKENTSLKIWKFLHLLLVFKKLMFYNIKINLIFVKKKRNSSKVEEKLKWYDYLQIHMLLQILTWTFIYTTLQRTYKKKSDHFSEAIHF